jgi:methylene-tetrahydromethanopterin dehydrogenase
VVGFSSAVIAALEGAISDVGRTRGGVEHVKETAAAAKARFNVDLAIVDGTTDAMKREVAASADVVLRAAAAGKRVLESAHLSAASHLLVVADVNAVPPSGVEGLGVSDDAKPLPVPPPSASGRSPSATSSTKPNPVGSAR